VADAALDVEATFIRNSMSLVCASLMDLANVGEEAREEHSMDRLPTAGTETAAASDALIEEAAIDGLRDGC
jgi:hypothetical protein